MSHDSWTHLLARRAIRPLLGTWVRPNHLTTLRLATGVAACALIATGTAPGAWWGGGLWLVSAFLDRADGELARVGRMMSRGGHLYDYYADNFVNALFFVAAGYAVQNGWLGAWAVPLGWVGGVSIMLCGWFSEALEQRSPPAPRPIRASAGSTPTTRSTSWGHWPGPGH